MINHIPDSHGQQEYDGGDLELKSQLDLCYGLLETWLSETMMMMMVVMIYNDLELRNKVSQKSKTR